MSAKNFDCSSLSLKQMCPWKATEMQQWTLPDLLVLQRSKLTAINFEAGLLFSLNSFYRKTNSASAQ